jgi:hypothetical protein
MREDPGEEALAEWFGRRLPESWAAGAPEVLGDNDEILVVVRPERVIGVDQWRDATREHRMLLAAEAAARFGRKVGWGVRVGDEIHLFTTASVPVMTRLRLPERQVLDTLIDAGVARSRSDALAWCVRLVGRNEEEWIAELRAAFAAVQQVRAKGPGSTRPGRS